MFYWGGGSNRYVKMSIIVAVGIFSYEIDVGVKSFLLYDLAAGHKTRGIIMRWNVNGCQD